MIFQSFLLGNSLSLYMNRRNSVVVVRLYYGFLTTFSIGPSYLFLLRARVIEEGTEKEVSATSGSIAEQFMMFILIYYASLHLALDRPHKITILVQITIIKTFLILDLLPKIQCVILAFNPFHFTKFHVSHISQHLYVSMQQQDFLFLLTSSFVGWLIGHIFFMKWVGLVLFRIRQNHSIRSNKYLVLELRNFMARIFNILLFITCVP
ncbi:hypothetical protein IEQ34_011244 [Dendrobium chrysotoxum]|uniref:Protein TIC 214 n=1 Tax=Dendrobium chrysotoxum TaxID=161865 RepID=A0AAV7GWZ9_DENCH|nr:hypothetical protein IEQ34_011244 [Dendrobium chrysotoxum]